MRLPPPFSFLVSLGRSGIPEIVISGFILNFALVQHSTALVFLAAFLLWPGLVNLYHTLASKKRPPEDE